MRSFLRADPDVIMVGEMRDKETTRIGIEASLTGHLVFSTLHTNSAPESITRLLDMGMDPFNFADAILAIMAQRLVRTLCQACRKPYHPARDEYDNLVRIYEPEAFEKSLNIPYSDDLTLYEPDGCDQCNNSGYQGRMAIHELLMGTDDIKRLIQTNGRIEEIREQAVSRRHDHFETGRNRKDFQRIYGSGSGAKSDDSVSVKGIVELKCLYGSHLFFILY